METGHPRDNKDEWRAMCARTKCGGTKLLRYKSCDLSFRALQIINAVQLITKQGHTVGIQIATNRNT